MLSKFGGVRYFDHLEQRVLDDRVGKSCGDIRDGCALLLRLLYFGIHEHGASCSKVDRGTGIERFMGEVFHGVVQ